MFKPIETINSHALGGGGEPVAAYEPDVWNDEGDYAGFYIDFKQVLQPFSSGMFTESIVVHDSEQLPVTGIRKVSDTVYYVSCNIANKNNGVTIINKVTSLLKDASGNKLAVFSVIFFVAGLAPYIRKGYVYDIAEYFNAEYAPNESVLFEFSDTQDSAYADSAEYVGATISGATDSVTISY